MPTKRASEDVKRNLFWYRSVFGCMLACFMFPAGAADCSIPDSVWQRPRSGSALTSLPGLRECVGGYLQQPSSRLVIHHGVTDESTLQAEELRYWMVALALDEKRIELLDDLGSNEPIRMEVKESK